MRRRDPFDMSIPIGFKLWFGFVAVCILAVWFVVGYGAYSVIQAGPEGIGRAIGQVIKGVDDVRR